PLPDRGLGRHRRRRDRGIKLRAPHGGGCRRRRDPPRLAFLPCKQIGWAETSTRRPERVSGPPARDGRVPAPWGTMGGRGVAVLETRTMPSPFPGMDPYLEAPAIWPDLHDALAGEIRNELNHSLPGPYYARL